LQLFVKVYRTGIFSIQTSITFSNNTKLKTEIEKESRTKKGNRAALGRPGAAAQHGWASLQLTTYNLQA
jgi:hypothetical protein